MVLSYMVATRVVHLCKVAILAILLCIVIEQMDLILTDIDLMVSPCMAVEGTIVLDSWGLQIDREKFLSEECPLDWVDPTKG
jgi:hypothetical protein